MGKTDDEKPLMLINYMEKWWKIYVLGQPT